MSLSSKTHDQDREDLRAMLSAPEGRRVLRRILGATSFIAPSYAPGDALATAYNEGLRAVGLWLFGEIENTAPGEFARLLLESSKLKEGNGE